MADEDLLKQDEKEQGKRKFERMMVNGPLELKLDEVNMRVLVIILHRFSDLYSWLH